jgi:hypothetical protein
MCSHRHLITRGQIVQARNITSNSTLEVGREICEKLG